LIVFKRRLPDVVCLLWMSVVRVFETVERVDEGRLQPILV
jgi:hypothetical protein